VARCILVKFLVVITFVTRCLHVGKDARDPTGEWSNYMFRELYVNFAEMTASMPFGDRFLSTNQRHGATATFRLSVTNMCT